MTDDFSPRRKPQQKRSRRTYETIVAAATDLLVEAGYHNMSTNKIAEHADVSVGSIYQYFPNKEAIILAVIERFAERQYEILADGLEGLARDDLRTVVRRVIDNMLEAKRDQPKLSRVLFEQLPPMGQHDILRDWTQRASELITATLADRVDELRELDFELASYILVNACHGVVHGVVSTDSGPFDDAKLAEETTELVLRYLKE
jgi:AcrR family transcriptional regulator